MHPLGLVTGHLSRDDVVHLGVAGEQRAASRVVSAPSEGTRPGTRRR